MRGINMAYKRIEQIWERTSKDIDTSKLNDLDKETMRKQIIAAFKNPVQKTFSTKMHSGNVENLATNRFAEALTDNSHWKRDFFKNTIKKTMVKTKTGKEQTRYRFASGFKRKGKNIGGQFVKKDFFEEW